MAIKISDILRNDPAGTVAYKVPEIIEWDRNPLFFHSFISTLVVEVSRSAKDPLLWKLRRDQWDVVFRRSKKRAGKSIHHWTKFKWDMKSWQPLGARERPIPIIRTITNAIRI